LVRLSVFQEDYVKEWVQRSMEGKWLLIKSAKVNQYEDQLKIQIINQSRVIILQSQDDRVQKLIRYER
jgi:hypothetical protein